MGATRVALNWLSTVGFTALMVLALSSAGFLLQAERIRHTIESADKTSGVFTHRFGISLSNSGCAANMSRIGYPGGLYRFKGVTFIGSSIPKRCLPPAKESGRCHCSPIIYSLFYIRRKKYKNGSLVLFFSGLPGHLPGHIATFAKPDPLKLNLSFFPSLCSRFFYFNFCY
jgi:hypothetical protein